MPTGRGGRSNSLEEKKETKEGSDGDESLTTDHNYRMISDITVGAGVYHNPGDNTFGPRK